jgi:hypothetical protein
MNLKERVVAAIQGGATTGWEIHKTSNSGCCAACTYTTLDEMEMQGIISAEYKNQEGFIFPEYVNVHLNDQQE